VSVETVAVTGGSGTIGSEIVDVLGEAGYRSVNLDRRRREDGAADAFVRVDLLDAGEVYGALARWDADAVIHMGTIPNPRGDPAHVTYESNVMSSYVVLEAAAHLGLEAVCLASSVNAHGWSFQEAPPEIDYLPIDEAHRVSPRDPYGLGKYVVEVTADGFGRRPGPPARIATLRFSSAHDDEHLRRLADRDLTLADLRERYDPGDNPGFRYLHVRDAATLAVRAIEPGADYAGHETFWAVAPDSTVTVPTEELLAAFYPDTEVRKPLTGTDGLFDVSKARELTDWEPRHTWRDYRP
jgi:nucleoside-diphosphate-sugar epimerase